MTKTENQIRPLSNRNYVPKSEGKPSTRNLRFKQIGQVSENSFWIQNYVNSPFQQYVKFEMLWLVILMRFSTKRIFKWAFSNIFYYIVGISFDSIYYLFIFSLSICHWTDEINFLHKINSKSRCENM